MHTYSSSLTLINTTVPGHLEADAEVPVLTGVQAQGDLVVYPSETPEGVSIELIPSTGIQVVSGEATGNTHWLHSGFNSPDVGFAFNGSHDGIDDLVLGWVVVPAGQCAYLLHTDEHGSNGIGRGSFAIGSKREITDVIRRVVD